MTNGRMRFSRHFVTLDSQEEVPGSPLPIPLGTNVSYGNGTFDIVKSLPLSITGNKTSTRVILVIVGREIE